MFSQNDLEINIQRISQKNYLQVNQINTNYIKQDITSLNNSVLLNSYEGSKRIKIEGNIYVKADPKTCFDRVKSRGREGENIPIEYLEKCHDYHEKWLSTI